MPERLDPAIYRDLVRRALAEDVGAGDVTTRAIVPPDLVGVGTFLVERPCVIAGLDVARSVFTTLDPTVTFTPLADDGDESAANSLIATVTGPAAALLTAERTALNFLQRLSGIATLTRRFVDAAGGAITILDTRKTTPTLRALEKYAVRCGGASSHRTGLFDAVLIKDNHIRIAGGVAAAVARVRTDAPGFPIEVEAQSLQQVQEALDAGVDIVMLDNLPDGVMREAIRHIDGRARVEISGGVTLARIPALAALGADTVSVGALTHSAPAADISLDLECSSPSPKTSPGR